MLELSDSTCEAIRPLPIEFDQLTIIIALPFGALFTIGIISKEARDRWFVPSRQHRRLVWFIEQGAKHFQLYTFDIMNDIAYPVQLVEHFGGAIL